jgi:hypothetical protein
VDYERVVSSAKKYWPFALGGLALIFFAPRLFGGGGGNSGGGEVAGYGPSEAEIAANVQLSGIAAQTQAVAINAEAASDVAALQLVGQLQTGLAGINADFLAAQQALFGAQRDVSISITNKALDAQVAGLLAAGESQAQYNAAIGQLGAASGQAIAGIAAANAASQSAVTGLLTTAIKYF